MTKIADFKFGFWLKTFFLCLFFSNILLVQTLRAQPDFNRRVSFQASGEKLSSVLSRLSINEKLNFSYNPSEKSFDAIVNYSAGNKPLEIVLKEILALSGHDFRLIGSQIVIFNVADEQSTPAITTPQTSRPVTLPARITDTVREAVIIPVRDTLYLRDTIIQIDTLILRDTIFIEKEVPRTVKPERPSPLKEDMFRFEADRNNGLSLMPFFSHLLSSNFLKAGTDDNELLRLTEEAESFSWVNQSFGVDARFSQNKWHITSGLKYTRFTNRFNYTYESFEGGFFRTDTVDIYYTIPQTDTIWHYVTDLTWVPLTSREFLYNRMNRLGYLEIPVYFGYSFYTNVNIRFWINTGVDIGLLTNRNGVAIQSTGEYTGIEFEALDFKPLVVSYALAAGVRYRVSEWVDLSAEVLYRQHLNSILRDYPLQKRIGAAGLKLGIVYYL